MLTMFVLNDDISGIAGWRPLLYTVMTYWEVPTNNSSVGIGTYSSVDGNDVG